MSDQRRIQLMLRNPKALMEFAARGRLPEVDTPSSPLISLIESIPAGFRNRITNVVVGTALGYQGQHRFNNLAQALNWLKPAYMAQSYPSESYRIKRFRDELTLQDLLNHCEIPERVANELSLRFPR